MFVFVVGMYAQQDIAVNAPNAGNPILPGYFADPTITKFGDTYYIYATTDNEMLGSGAPTVWYSDDLTHWYNYIMDIPPFTAKPITNFWAPDIVKGDDGKYYLYFGNCEIGCNIYGYVSDTPIGPWTKLFEDDTAVIPSGYPRKDFPSLDAQFFRDTDGKIYGYWGTWVHYNGGYAVGQLNGDTMADMLNSKNIPLEQTPEPFEAVYMMKKGDKYILMYSGASCHDETYNVRYSYADSPYGPFTEGENNPILSTNKVQTTHGPGHHSVLQKGGEYYIIYHKHDYPFTAGGLSRQVCLDNMVFENDSTIAKVVPTSKGVHFNLPSKVPTDLAFGKKATASSFYHLKSTQYDYEYKPSYAVDNNNATLWKAGDNTFPQSLTLDLGAVKKVRRIATEFEFPTHYYQYKIEYSKDGTSWKTYVDRTRNKTPGSPMIDDAKAKARYIRLTITGCEKTGVYAAVWNIKVYGEQFPLPLPLKNKPLAKKPGTASTHSMLVAIDAKSSKEGQFLNTGSLGGFFEKEGKVTLGKDESGINALMFEQGALVLNRPVPRQLEWNGAFTVATWVKNPEVDSKDECLFSWCDRFKNNLAASFTALFYNSGHYGATGHLEGHYDMPYTNVPSQNTWHHIVLTFDGINLKVYVDGKLDNSQNMTLASQVEKAKMRIGASDTRENYSGYMASLRMYDYALGQQEIHRLLQETDPK